jgi:hypothetical protein
LWDLLTKENIELINKHDDYLFDLVSHIIISDFTGNIKFKDKKSD